MNKKGMAGYISARKKQVILKTILEFGVIVALLVLGILQTGSRKNLLTVVAIVGCLPAAKAMVEMIMMLPHRTISKTDCDAIEACATDLTRLYDLVFTSEKKVMPVSSIVVYGNNICGYTSDTKVDVQFAAKHIQTYLQTNGLGKTTVKIYQDFNEYRKRVKDMNLMAQNGEKETRKNEEAIRGVILNLSL